MRVIAGSARGRKLESPAGSATRPTGNRVREAIFNSLVSLDVVNDARVIDLFAGTGALGIEALSRGAQHCVFIETDRRARQIVERNLENTQLRAQATIVGEKCEQWLASATSEFDVVLADPPYSYGQDEWSKLFALLAPRAARAVIVCESDSVVPVPNGWYAQKEKWYGGTLITVLCPLENSELS